ncbi:SDR family NAD(P)-dependent oxidoreductase [Microbacterium saperdae]|uniref:NAD(P)-dependent dehydrogenase (Short-subunit alcohol dehydrogenase family) n=1 Tax=Microbacterium saperdae TaxID=69368 RepID=A0A543BIS3_9MICO|nr:SDR family NAD(P)-dependent oxidoreductase [Microbacterium saperdae]TQL84759.1 NAD(P)-dependent dehydrogenase (short-subunit alcohol dehydrogenase family) [Microbacterium saperdae]GGM64256.1 short-chain dehydrogenase [Microbacterium saperdae]
MAEGVEYRDLAGRHLLVTGGGSGIGLACVQALLGQGCAVSLFDRDPSAARRWAQEQQLSGRLLITAGDVRDTDALDAWVSRAESAFGVPQGLVVSAGIEPESDAAVHVLDEEVWEHTLAVNAGGMFRSVKHGVKALLDGGGGSVVLMGSPTGSYGMELGHHAYSASKGAVVGLGRVMANEYAPASVRVNIVWPGLIETPMNGFLQTDERRTERERAAIPLGTIGRPEHVAAMVLFLLSDQSAYCTGGVFVVDGGLTAV